MSHPRLSLLLAAVLAAPLAASAAPQYTINPLVPAGNTPFVASGLNNGGQVIGTFTPAGMPSYPVLVTGSTFTPMATSMRSEFLGWTGRAVNDAGTVVAITSTQAEVIIAHTAMPLGNSAYNTGAAAINNHGQVAGTMVARDDPHFAPHAYVDSPGGAALLLNDTGYRGSAASDINDAGTVVGYVSYGCNCYGGDHAFLYADGQLHELGTLGGKNSGAYAVNNNNIAVGYAQLAGNLRSHAAMFANGAVSDLGVLPGSDDSYAYDVNIFGEIIGTASSIMGTSTPFLYLDGTMVDLNTLLDPAAGWHLTRAIAINDNHQILAVGTDLGGVSAPVLLSLAIAPVPEPASYAALLGGLALLGITRRQKRGAAQQR